MGDDELDRETAFRLLSHVYRRSLLECLDRYGESLALADAAETVARASEPTVPDAEYGQIYLSLYHSHVPKLADAGVVAYDHDRELVTLTDRGERLVAVKEELASPDADS